MEYIFGKVVTVASPLTCSDACCRVVSRFDMAIESVYLAATVEANPLSNSPCSRGLHCTTYWLCLTRESQCARGKSEVTVVDVDVGHSGYSTGVHW